MSGFRCLYKTTARVHEARHRMSFELMRIESTNCSWSLASAFVPCCLVLFAKYAFDDMRSLDLPSHRVAARQRGWRGWLFTVFCSYLLPTCSLVFKSRFTDRHFSEWLSCVIEHRFLRPRNPIRRQSPVDFINDDMAMKMPIDEETIYAILRSFNKVTRPGTSVMIPGINLRNMFLCLGGVISLSTDMVR